MTSYEQEQLQKRVKMQFRVVENKEGKIIYEY